MGLARQIYLPVRELQALPTQYSQQSLGRARFHLSRLGVPYHSRQRNLSQNGRSFLLPRCDHNSVQCCSAVLPDPVPTAGHGGRCKFSCAQQLFLTGPQHRIQPVFFFFFHHPLIFHTLTNRNILTGSHTAPVPPCSRLGQAADIALLLQAFLSPRVPWKHAWLCPVLRG